MLKIGITGGIGSGKSIVCKILESMNYPVFYSDREAKIIIEENLDVRSEIIRLFGNDIYHGDQLNSKLLAQVEDRQKTDAKRFKEAGQGPLVKTYPYNPTKVNDTAANKPK